MKINHFSQIGKRSNNEDSLGHSAGLLTLPRVCSLCATVSEDTCRANAPRLS